MKAKGFHFIVTCLSHIHVFLSVLMALDFNPISYTTVVRLIHNYTMYNVFLPWPFFSFCDFRDNKILELTSNKWYNVEF